MHHINQIICCRVKKKLNTINPPTTAFTDALKVLYKTNNEIENKNDLVFELGKLDYDVVTIEHQSNKLTRVYSRVQNTMTTHQKQIQFPNPKPNLETFNQIIYTHIRSSNNVKMD